MGTKMFHITINGNSPTVGELVEKSRFHYGYVIVALSFLAMVAAMGIRGSFGTYVTGWEETFSINRFQVNVVSFVSLVVYGISVAVAGRLTDRIGPRKILTMSMVCMGGCLLGSFFAANIWHMVLLYGLFGSIGFGFASNVTVSVAIVRWFKEKKGFMISLVVVGMAVGPMLFGPINIFMIDMIGWKWLFVIYGAVYTLVFLPLFFLFYRDRPAEDGEREEKTARDAVREAAPAAAAKEAPAQQSANRRFHPVRALASVFSIFRYPVTWVICFVYIVCGFTDVGLINAHMIPLGESRGYSPVILSNSMLLYGLTNILGTIFIGYLTDRFSNQRILFGLFMFRAASILLLIAVDHPGWMLVFAFLYGFTDIATIAPFTMLCSNIYGEKQMGSAFGLISFFHQFGAASGSLIPGLLFSLSSSYLSTLWLCTGLLVVSAFMIAGVRARSRMAA